MELHKPVTGLACDSSQVRIVICDVPDKPGNAGRLFSLLANKGLSVDMIIQSYARSSNNTNDIAFTIDKTDLSKFNEVVGELKEELKPSNFHIDEDIAKVSIVGAGMIDRPGIAAKMFETLAQLGINIKMISTSEIRVTVLVNKEDMEKAMIAAHGAFKM